MVEVVLFSSLLLIPLVFFRGPRITPSPPVIPLFFSFFLLHINSESHSVSVSCCIRRPLSFVKSPLFLVSKSNCIVVPFGIFIILWAGFVIVYISRKVVEVWREEQ